MKHADQWWRDQVMALFNDHPLRWPLAKEDIVDRVRKAANLSREFPCWPYVEKAVRQLRDAGQLEYAWDYGGWQMPDYRERKKAADNAEWAKIEADRVAAEIADAAYDKAFDAYLADSKAFIAGDMSVPPIPPVRPDERRRRLIAALQAKADSTGFPAEEAALRAKIIELQGASR